MIPRALVNVGRFGDACTEGLYQSILYYNFYYGNTWGNFLVHHYRMVYIIRCRIVSNVDYHRMRIIYQCYHISCDFIDLTLYSIVLTMFVLLSMCTPINL